MPRDMSGTGRYPPVPRHAPISFYSAVRLGDPELLAKVMAVDPYFITQDNGAGAPLHFAVTYCQLDMAHHLLNNGAEVNQRDGRELTPLHRAAHLAHLPGYLELYEYLLSRGADPSLASNKFDPYLRPGPLLPRDLAPTPEVAAQLEALEARYVGAPKARMPHPDIGDWWALYDYGPDVVRGWAADYVHPYPEERRRQREREERGRVREAQRARRDEFLVALAQGGPDAARRVAAATTVPPPHGLGMPRAGRGAAVGSRALAPASAAATAAGAASSARGSGPAPVALLYPGQGSQAVGMLSESAALPEVAAMLATASAALGYDLLERCTQGPKEALDDTRVAQPALFVAGLAAAQRLKLLDPGAASTVSAAAGLSLGEYTALVWGGAMSFEDGLQVVCARAAAMANAAAQGEPHGMLSVVGLADAALDTCIARALAEVPPVAGGTVCQLANYLFPQGRVVSGHNVALARVTELALEAGALKAQMLAVSGAFHTRLMAPAREILAQALAAVEVRAPRVPIYSNVTAQPFPEDPDEIRMLLGRQLVEPVQWEATLSAMLQAGKAAGTTTRLFEVGPGQQIKAMVRRMDGDAWRAFTNVSA